MEKVFNINNLDCANCGAKIEDALSKLEGIESAVLNFPMKKLKVHGDISEEMVRRMHETARKIEPDVEFIPAEGHHHEHEHHHEHHDHCCDHEHEHHHHHDADDAKGKEFTISNLDCAHCGGKIEEMLNSLEGIESAVLNFPMKKFIIRGEVDDALLALMNEKANAIEPGVVIAPVSERVHSESHSHEEEESTRSQLIPLSRLRVANVCLIP